MPDKRSSAKRSRSGRGLTSPQLAAAEDEVEDGADPPEEGDDDPQDLPQPAQVLAVDDVDHAEHEGDGVEKDREQDFDDELDHLIAAWSGLGTRGHPPEGA